MKPKDNRSTLLPNDEKLCKLYQKIGDFATGLNRLPDAQEVRKDRAKSVPAAQLPMVF